MKLLHLLVQMPVRWLVPMVLVLLALLASGVNYAVQIQGQLGPVNTTEDHRRRARS